MGDSRNYSGQAYALSVLTPILAGRECALARVLDSLPTGTGSPLANVPGTHFARWVIVGDVVYEGGAQRRRDHLELARLLFTSNFDTRREDDAVRGPGAQSGARGGDGDEPGAYLRALHASLGPHADAIWGHCLGYPGDGNARTFAQYLRAHQVESSLFFAAYGERTVEDVKRSLALRRRLIAFALEAQGKPPAELQAAFAEAFAS